MNNTQQQIEIIVSKRLSDFIEDDLLIDFLSSEIYYILKDANLIKTEK